MNKKLLAVAVAGALAAPVVAFAQSSVTISGVIKMSMEGYSLGNYNRGTGNKSQTLLADDSSRIIFNMLEDLGGGLQADVQIDWRVVPDSGADSVGGNNHIGLRSKQWGRIFFGRQDVHYFGRESDLTVKNDLKADSVSLLAFAGGNFARAVTATGGLSNGGVAIAGATRTSNIVHYTTPNWNGFSAIVAYSFNPQNPEADIGAPVGVSTRKGYAWNVAPVYEGRNFTVGYSYWSQKQDANSVAAEVAANQRGDRLFGSYRWGGFRIGLAWDRSKVNNENIAASAFTTDTLVAKRDAYSIPVEYSWGPHWIGGHYTRANDDKATSCSTVGAAACAAGLDKDGAKMWAIGYNYSLSKRTSVGVSYAQIKNDAGAAYVPFTSTGGLGSGSNAIVAGEDPRLWSMTIRHAF